MESRRTPLLWRQLLAVHRDDTKTLQAQVKQMLVAAILDGLLPALACLPSTRDLADALGVSRNTIMLVY